LDAVFNYASHHKWDAVVLAGDLVDNNSISSHNAGNLRAIDGETILKDYEHIQKNIMDPLEQATPGAQKILLEGNHEYRAERLVSAQPQLAGLVEAQYGLGLERRGWLWVPYWTTGKTWDNGKASFGHGRYTNLHHAYKHALAYGRNFYYGHLHDIQEHTVERDGDDSKFEAASLGCLCEYRQFYMQGRPSRWQQAFSIFRFQKNGHFNRYTVRIFDHKFLDPEDKLYKG